MNRKPSSNLPKLIAAAALALGAAGNALADDSSMSRLTGDSYAFFNDLDYNPGRFNTARAPRQGDDAVAKAPRQIQDRGEKRIMLSDRPRVTLPSPFRDDTGA